jgi:DNA-binding MarR family transcriptional regulator
MAKQLPEESITAWARLIRTQRVLLERVEADLKTAELPPLAWYDVLLEVNRPAEGRIRQYEIGEKVLLSKYNVSRLVDRLEEEKLVRRTACEEDGRGSVVEITPAGKALLRRMWPVYARAIERYFASRLTGAETERLAELMAKLLREE